MRQHQHSNVCLQSRLQRLSLDQFQGETPFFAQSFCNVEVGGEIGALTQNDFFLRVICLCNGQRSMRVLENLQLDHIEEGDYELIALPLKLMSADAGTVRAILREL